MLISWDLYIYIYIYIHIRLLSSFDPPKKCEDDPFDFFPQVNIEPTKKNGWFGKRSVLETTVFSRLFFSGKRALCFPLLLFLPQSWKWKNGCIWKGTTIGRDPLFLTSMIMGGRVTPLGIPKNRLPSAISEFRNTQVQPGQQQYMVHISRVNVLQMTLCLLEASGGLRMILFFF